MTSLTVTGLHKGFPGHGLPGDSVAGQGSGRGRGTAVGHRVLTGLNLTVPAGSLTALLGPSGSGKTTLLRVLAGFERADAGTVMIGSAVADGPGVHLPPERRRIGYVPQEGSLFPHLNVLANIGFGLARRDRRGRAADLLDAVGLAGFGRRYPHQLSGGQQQRVALARALAIRPQIVLLDEPFAALDAQLRASVRADVMRLLRAAGTTAVLVTHDQDEALSVADLVAVLRGGTIAQHGTPQELYACPVDAEMARFIGDANLIEGVLDGTEVDTPLGRLPVARGGGAPAGPGPVTVLVRPEQVELGLPQAGPWWLAGRVVGCGYHGHDTVLRVRPERDPDAPPVIVRAPGNRGLPPGSLVTLRAHGPVLAWPREPAGG
jgi:iron(III) transport system ATP-binding protein